VSGPDFWILVRRSKRRGKHKDEYERVYLPPGLGVELRDYVTGNRIAPEDRVFPITDRQVRYVFAAAGKRGIGRPVHPHELRHLYVKTLIDGGVPVLVASIATAWIAGFVTPGAAAGMVCRVRSNNWLAGRPDQSLRTRRSISTMA